MLVSDYFLWGVSEGSAHQQVRRVGWCWKNSVTRLPSVCYAYLKMLTEFFSLNRVDNRILPQNHHRESLSWDFRTQRSITFNQRGISCASCISWTSRKLDTGRCSKSTEITSGISKRWHKHQQVQKYNQHQHLLWYSMLVPLYVFQSNHSGV